MIDLMPNVDKVTKAEIGKKYRMKKVHTQVCERCQKEKTSKNWYALDASLNEAICNGCYGEVLKNG